ncbi:GntR family transcriptional regulator [Actibacterium mucosum KCTC 23349]|uniref:GntR family transcriptional regulator n=1 Tax=Actibacterium mucosum KCTC 23349 TaxID=1454373 RepID=A0A037ZHS5_9RHOB|nr:phosphonate metabolism transcriptional regulator PhnF [Actibacterium mucosum]KAJ55683.1 GntR family transcriptional regulator [Actibacterium mucosum KCTC 23349]
MANTPLWKSIAMSLTSEIANGHYKPGDRLPTEAELSRRFQVNRHTVRRALQDMNESGLVHSRRGAGVFVASTPTDYPLGRRVRFSQNIAQAGKSSWREILLLEKRAPNRAEAEALELAEGDLVHVAETLAMQQDTPIALSRHVFSAERFPDILQNIEATGSITQALKRSGVADYTRAHTRLTAKSASAAQATRLRIREGDPILRTTGVNIDSKNQPIEYGRTWFVGDRISLIVSPE